MNQEGTGIHGGTGASSPGGELRRALERLERLVDWERRDRRGARLELAQVRDLLGRLGQPQERFRAVHVGGTKGKGSVASLVAAALERAGARVGCYTSPHVERVHERIRVAGRELDDPALAEALEAALAARAAALEVRTPGADATWFDVVTAAAFHAFARAQVDWAVVEVGLGGRLDSTNVLSPEVCAITGVDLEHTDVLGDSLEAIAREKAGILKPGVDFVCGAELEGRQGPAGRVLAEVAGALGIAIRRPDPASRGKLSARNRALAHAILDALGERGLAGPGGAPARDWLDPETERRAALPGRLERLELGGVPVVLDGAHVASSVSLVLDELGGTGLPGPPVVVLALARDKDARAVLKALEGRVDRVLSTTLDGGRHVPAADLARLAGQVGIRAVAVPRPEEALQLAVRRAQGGRWALATGSLYLAGALRPALRAATRPTAPCPPSSRTCS